MFRSSMEDEIELQGEKNYMVNIDSNNERTRTLTSCQIVNQKHRPIGHNLNKFLIYISVLVNYMELSSYTYLYYNSP